MALGGGTWIFQNKILPGAYINFQSKVRPTVDFADRGYCAMTLDLDWGAEGQIFAVEVGEFQKDSLKIFGYDYASEKLKGLRDLFKNLKTGYFYRLANGAKKAASDLATAKYGGIRGNDLSVAVQTNIDDETAFDVVTYILVEGSKTAIDKQTVKVKADLKDNNYVTFKQDDAVLAVTAGVPLTGGTNGDAVTAAQHQEFLDKIEPYYFNTLGCASTETAMGGKDTWA